MEVKKFESDQWIYCQNVFLSRFLSTLFLPNRRSKIIILIQICSISIWKHLFTLLNHLWIKRCYSERRWNTNIHFFCFAFLHWESRKNDRQHNLHSAYVFCFFLPRNNFLPLKIDGIWKNLKKLILHFFLNFCLFFSRTNKNLFSFCCFCVVNVNKKRKS